MKKEIKSIILHTVEGIHNDYLSDSINDLHIMIIERRLNQSNLTTSEKLDIINKIIDNIKSRET